MHATVTVAVWVVDYLLNSAWQLPLVYVVASLAARGLRRMGAEVGHRVWVAALLLSVVLPGCRFREWPQAWWKEAAGAAGGHVQVAFLPGGVGVGSGLRFPPALQAALLVAYAGTVVYFAARLAWGWWRTVRLRNEAHIAELPDAVQARWRELRSRVGGVQAELCVSASVDGPLVVGVRRHALLVPLNFFTRVAPLDVYTALAHELAHLQRGDFAKNLAYTALAVPVAYHPCVGLLRRRVAESREMVCDGVAAQLLDGRRQYAQSLLRLALAMPAVVRGSALPAVGILDGNTDNTLEQRVVHMMSKHKELHGAARLAVVAGAVLLGGATCVLAVEMRVGVGAAPTAAAAEKPRTVKVASSVMAGNIETKVMPEYPAKAKADHDTVNGTVTLGATINKDGEITDLHLVKSLRKDYDESALTAVQKWRWKPYLLNGEPVAVETEVHVTYSLAK